MEKNLNALFRSSSLSSFFFSPTSTFQNQWNLKGERKISTLLWDVSKVVVTSLICYHFYLKTYDSDNNKYFKRKHHKSSSSTHNNSSNTSTKKEETITWLDQTTYDVLVSFVDALIPSLSIQDCTKENMEKIIRSMDENLLNDPNSYLSLDDLLQNKAYLLRGAVDYGTHKQFAEAIQKLVSKEEGKKLAMILKVVSTSIGNFVITGYPAPFQQLPLWARERALRWLRDSPIADLRGLFQALKRLTGVLYFSYAERDQENPAWKVLQYDPASTVAKNFTTDEERDNQRLKQAISYAYAYQELEGRREGDTDILDVDVVIVGSGCGGGVMAGELIAAGYNVLVLEKGGYFQPPEFARWREGEAMVNLYERGGLTTSSDGGIIVLAGSCVGGGSTVNWLASFRTPDQVLADWESVGLTAFRKGGEFEQSMDYIHQKFSVNCNNSHYAPGEERLEGNSFKVNGNNRLLWKGAEACGSTPEKVPRNAKKCVDCGSCCFGCSYRSKQSTLNVIIEPILLNQLKETSENGGHKIGKLYVIPDCKVLNITTMINPITGKKVATGVNAFVSIFDTKLGPTIERTLLGTRKLRVTSRITISSCGSIWTPALLINSGFKHNKIGKYLTLHPVLGCGALYPKNVKTELASGVSMGVVVKKAPRIELDVGNHQVSLKYLSEKDLEISRTHGVAIETPPAHLGIFGLLLPWNSGIQMKLMALAHSNASAFIGIARDHCSERNRIEVDSEGSPVIHYQVSKEDEKMLLIGLERQIRLQFASGAKYIFLGHSTFPWFDCQQEKAAEKLNNYIDQIWKEGIVIHRMSIFCAHQMSSCRMGKKREDGPTSPSGELYECENLFIADGSILPTSLGINPMITIEAMSHMISKNVIARLNSSF